jgi:FAD/FMN-containing dehydrogenase
VDLKCPNCASNLRLELAPSSPQLAPSSPQTHPKVEAVEGDSSKALDLEVLNTNPQTGRKRFAYSDEDFARFWAIYPRRVGKAAAYRKWKLAVREVAPQTIIEAARKFEAANRLKDPQFIPYPEGWLNAGRWEDDDPAIVDNTPRETDFIAESDAEYQRILDLLEKGELS